MIYTFIIAVSVIKCDLETNTHTHHMYRKNTNHKQSKCSVQWGKIQQFYNVYKIGTHENIFRLHYSLKKKHNEICEMNIKNLHSLQQN